MLEIGYGGSFSFLLPHNILLRIVSYKPPLADDGADQVFWDESTKGCFIVKLAYHALSKTILSDEEKLWSLAWSWKGGAFIFSSGWCCMIN